MLTYYDFNSDDVKRYWYYQQRLSTAKILESRNMENIKATKEEHSTGAQKETKGKLPFHLIPPEALEGLAQVLAFGAFSGKYSPRNWEKGLLLEEHHYAAAERHMQNWRKGINIDNESQLNHLKHAMWHLMAMVTQIERGRTDLDDRVTVK